MSSTPHCFQNLTVKSSMFLSEHCKSILQGAFLLLP
ncbi:hypothetical protein LEMLEM_LOCUS6892, partial [Lemmus lemmus]